MSNNLLFVFLLRNLTRIDSMLRKRERKGKEKWSIRLFFNSWSIIVPYQDTSGWYPRYESKESQRLKQIPSIERDLDFGGRRRSGIKRSIGREMESLDRFSRSDFIVLLCFRGSLFLTTPWSDHFFFFFHSLSTSCLSSKPSPLSSFPS